MNGGWGDSSMGETLYKHEALSADPGTLESHTMHVVAHMYIPALPWKNG